MNIFVVDKDPLLAASYLCDAHVVKMIVESCQLLSTADQLFYNKPQEDRYRITHQNHPCCKCLSNPDNYLWLCLHLRALLNEYFIRYDRTHSCTELYLKYWDVYKDPGLRPNHDRLTLPKCVGDFWEEGDDIDIVVNCYRNYYRWKRDNMSRFNYRLGKVPVWLD